MPKYVGARSEIAFTKEGTRLTAAAAQSGNWKPHEGYEFKPVVEKVERVSGMGDITQLRAEDITGEYAEGTVPLILSTEFVGDFANMIMGQAPTSSDAGGGNYSHAWTLANRNDHLTYTVSTYDPMAGSKKYAGGLLNSATIEMAPEDYVRATLEMIAMKEATASLTPAYSTTDTFFRPTHAAIKYATAYAGLGAAAEVTLSALTLNINKNASRYMVLGSTEPADNANGRISITGSLTLAYENTDFRTIALANTSEALQIVLTSGADVFTIELPLCTFGDWSKTPDLDNYMTNTINFKATGGDATNGLIKIAVTDQSATH
jgi:hypothetical protein